ncbi:hypothetical protein Tco_0890837 [Tanacetum coccineum]|uniref:Uncharacterized protein n=1 Tax=Tanacetum coccineum TaxID=301880 RepID=A0ABQ5C1K5_9ASTR
MNQGSHTEISSPFEGLSNIGSQGVVGPEHEGLPWMLDDPYVQVALQAPPSPDYIPGPEEPQSPPLPDFVLEPPLPAAASPTAQSPDYVRESDPEADPEEDDEEDPEENPVDYPADGGDDGDDEDESSEDDEDDDVDIKADDDEKEAEHPAPTDSTAVALPAADQAPSVEETGPFQTDESAATPPPHPAYRVTARNSIPDLVPTPVWSGAEVARLLAISTPPSSPLSPWLRAEAASTSYSLPLPPPIILSYTRPDASSSRIPPLHLLSTDRREDIPEVTLPPRKRLGIALDPRYEIGESSSAVVARPAGGLRATMDEIVEAMQGTPVVTDVVDLSQRMTEFETRVRRDTYEVYTRLDDEQSSRQLLAGRLNMLFRDRRAHAQVMSLRITVLAQQSQIRELQPADCRRQTVITEMLAANHRRQKQLTEPLKLIKRLQTQMTEFERQQGPAKGPAQPELPEEAGSSS